MSKSVLTPRDDGELSPICDSVPTPRGKGQSYRRFPNARQLLAMKGGAIANLQSVLHTMKDGAIADFLIRVDSTR